MANKQDQERRNTLKINELIQELGKVPPQAIDLEEAVIGALLMEGSSYARVTWLNGSHFYKETNRIVFEHIAKFGGKGCDILTVMDALKKSDNLDLIGGPYALTQYTNKVSTASHLEEHAEIVYEKFKLRECIRIGTFIQDASFNQDTETVSRLGMELVQVQSMGIKKEIRQVGEDSSTVYENIVNITTGSQEFSGIPTEFYMVDRMIYGLNAPDLVIIAARPGMGKTALAMAIALNVAKQGHAVLFDSLEMSMHQLLQRAWSYESEINMNKFRIKNGLNDSELDDLAKAKGIIDELPLYIDDTPAQHILAVKAKARQMKIQHDIKLLVVDYMQLMHGEGNNREQEIASISGGLKAVAKELDIPVIALSQMNRSVESRGGDKKPRLSDLRESGAIEQDADIVIFPYRPEYYDIKDIDGVDSEGKCIISIAKNRQGPIGDVMIAFEKKTIKFKNIEEDSFSGGGKETQQDLFQDHSNEEAVF